MKKKKISKLIAGTLSASVIVNFCPDNVKTVLADERSNLNDNPNSDFYSGFDTMSEDNSSKLESNVNEGAVLKSEQVKSDVLYLSNIDYDKEQSKTDWKDIMKDANTDGNNIRLLVDGNVTSFAKGMGAHATSTLVYDISNYSNMYTRLITYLGVDYAQYGKGDGVTYTISTSKDGQVWEKIYSTDVLTSSDNCEFVDINVEGVKYIKLFADQYGNRSNDHSVYGDLKLVKTNYDINNEKYTKLHTVSYYDDIISKHTPKYNYENNLNLVLQREFVNRVGYNNIQSAVRDEEGVREALDWLLADKYALQLFIEAGSLYNGSGYKTLKALGKLYINFKDCLGDLGDAYIYKKMLIATAVAYCKDIRTFMVTYGGSATISDPVVKFRKFKELYDNDKFVRKEEFKSYNMELVRYVMDSKIDDGEIEWLRDYIDIKQPDINSPWRYNGYGYVKYENVSYNQPRFYDEENREMWDQKYNLSKYNIEYGEKNRYRLWMLMEAGGICWGITGVAINVNEVQGIATVNTYQPGHEATLVYSENKEGKGVWNILDNVGGWSQSFTRWGNDTSSEARLLLGWGIMDFNTVNKGNNSTYILLAQDALNNYDSYLKSMFYNLISNSYEKGSEKHEDALKKSLEHLNTNLDSIYGLIKSYKADENTTEEEWMELVRHIVNVYTYFPAPMVDLLNLISPYITSDVYKAEVDMLRTDALYKASKATTNESLQPEDCKNIANSLLGANTVNLASFSFDGDNAGRIILDKSYDSYNLMVRISLDGGDTWEKFNETGETTEYTSQHNIKLTEEQLKKINSTDDILVGLVGTNTNYTIDIKDGKNIDNNNIYKNDDENLLIGPTENLEYSIDGGEIWRDYESGLNSNTRIEGNVTAKFRYKAHGVYLQGAESEYKFHEDIIDPKSRYLQLKNVKLHTYSSQHSDTHNHAATNFIDGSGNTAWHTKYSFYDDKYYSVEFDKVRYINKLTYLPGGQNGRLKAGQVYTSMDGADWKLACEFSGLENNTNLQTIDLGKNIEGKYLKIIATENYGNSTEEGKMYFSGKMLNFYEDTTVNYKANANIKYSIEEATNKNVTATLVLPEGCTSEETEFIFEQNGKHTFTFKDANGEEQTIDAEVTWIDKEAPTMTYEFSKNTLTNEDVTVTITGFSEDNVKIIGINENPNLDEEVDSESGVYSNTYTFKENGTVVFTIQDKVGNVSNIPITVNWIDKLLPDAKLKYDINSLTNQSVTVTLEEFNKKGIIVLNNDGKTSYTFDKNGTFDFEIIDLAGNKNIITAEVTWIDKEAPNVTVDFNTEDPTNKDVVAVLKGLEDGDKIISEGGETHTFTENGIFEFIIVDKAGNETRIPVNVNWIDKTIPVADIVYDVEEWTNGQVKATLSNPSEDITILNPNDGSDHVIFDTNDSFTFEFVDRAGNKGTAKAKVTWIDKEAPDAIVEYSTKKPTNKPVTVTLTNFTEDGVKIKNNNGSPNYTFESNGKFEFVIVDRAGNEKVIPVEVDWIDTIPADIKVEYDVQNLTNGNVVATLVGLEDGDKVISEGGETHIFTENGTFEFIVRDKAGNESKIVAEVTWIDKEGPIADVIYSTQNPTNGSVTVTLENFSEEGVTIKNNDGKFTYVFDNNGTFEFILLDKAGNETVIPVKVDWIDKTPPIVNLIYSTINPTNTSVTVTLDGLQEGEYVVNNNNSNSYKFDDNGTFEFIVRDRAGNETKSVAVVDWIDKVAPIAAVEYDINALTNGVVTAKLVNVSEDIEILNTVGGVNYKTFEDNGEFEFIIMDKAGNINKIAAKVSWIDKNKPDNLVSLEDVISSDSNDASKVNLVVAKLNLDLNKYEILNNEGSPEYVFRKNETFVFKVRMIDTGYEIEIPVVVDWIKEKVLNEEVIIEKDSIKEHFTSNTNKQNDKNNILTTENNNSTLNEFILSKDKNNDIVSDEDKNNDTVSDQTISNKEINKEITGIGVVLSISFVGILFSLIRKFFGK